MAMLSFALLRLQVNDGGPSDEAISKTSDGASQLEPKWQRKKIRSSLKVDLSNTLND